MVQRIKVQSGRVVYEASDTTYDLSMDVSGQVNISKELNVGNDPLADGLIRTEINTDLILAPGTNGDINLQPSGTGDVVIKNSVWPTTTPVPGMYLGASAANTLEFQYFIWPTLAGSDSLNSSQLNLLFPTVLPGQQVLGPNVVYQRVSASQWRTMAGLPYVPVNIAGDTMLGPLYLSGSPISALEAATKQYVDDVASGLTANAACETATISALPSSTYNNGSGGIGATLTATANGALGSVGGYSGLAVGGRVLVKNQSNAIQNGIYVVTQLGSAGTPWILTRASDFDGAPTNEITAGDFVYVQEGTLGGTQWVQITVGTGISGGQDYVIVGTDNIVFTQLSGSGTYVGGTGINVASNVISNTGVLSLTAGAGITVSSSTGNITVSSSGGTVTSVGIAGGTGISVSGSPITSSGTITLNNTGVTSLTAGSNVSLSGSTGAVTISVTGSVGTSANLSGGLATQVPFQSAPSTTTFSAGLTYNDGTGTLSVGTATTGTVSAQTGQALEIQSDVSISLKTGGITRATVDSSGNFTTTNNAIRSVATGITATGATLGTATSLTKDMNVVSTVATGTGVSLMPTSGGMSIIIVNIGANNLNVYPNSASVQIDFLGVGTAFVLPVGARIMFFSVSATQWYTLNATYS